MIGSHSNESRGDGGIRPAMGSPQFGGEGGDLRSHGIETMVHQVPSEWTAPSNEDKFEPDITAFTCIYCGAMAGDSAGAKRVTYPANVKIIRLPCTGKVDSEYILKAFEQGADGVYVMACPIGNCHHERGNVRATKRVEYVKKLLDEIGLGRERLAIYYVSGGQGHAFADAAREMTAHIRRIGPSPVKRS